MLTLPIARSWEGGPLDPAEHAAVAMRLGRRHLHLEINAPFSGDPAPEGPAGPRWALWEHEVVELFVLGADGRYTEIELGPFGHHLVLRLRGVRDIAERELPLQFNASRSGDRWQGAATLDRSFLPEPPHRVNAYRIWGVGAARRYAAFAPVPGPTVDFHRLDCFVPMRIPGPGSARRG